MRAFEHFTAAPRPSCVGWRAGPERARPNSIASGFRSGRHSTGTACSDSWRREPSRAWKRSRRNATAARSTCMASAARSRFVLTSAAALSICAFTFPTRERSYGLSSASGGYSIFGPIPRRSGRGSRPIRCSPAASRSAQACAYPAHGMASSWPSEQFSGSRSASKARPRWRGGLSGLSASRSSWAAH